MRTYVYVDGFNLYYGAVKDTPYKWLDLKALFARILRPENKILAIKYYTAKVSARPGDPGAPTRQTIEEVVKTEEKGSDVNLALHVLNDAWEDRYDCAVICSNDSDLREALRLVKTRHKKKVVLVVPGDPAQRPAAIQLKRYANAEIRITQADLAASQLPSPIPGTTLRKPATW